MEDGAASMTYLGHLDKALTRAYRTPDVFITITQSSSVSDPTGPFDEVYNRVTDYLRLPRNPKKDQQGTCVTVLGIQIDSIAMEARLPPEKLCRATVDAAATLKAASLSLKQTERLAGLLAFCPRVFRLGRTRLQSLYTFQAAFPHGRSARRRTPHETAGWPIVTSFIQAMLPHWPFAQDAHVHINTNEVDAILQGFLLFSHHWLHHTLVIHTDSSTAHTGLKKGFLHGPPNVPLKSLLILAAARDIHIVPHWLPSGENTLADALSRPLGIELPAWFSSRAPQLNTGHLKLLWNGLSANTRSVYLSVQRSCEKHCALHNLSAWPVSRHSLTSWLSSRLLGNTSQKAVKPDTALTDLAALRAYHIDNFLDDKLFDNKSFRRLIDGARRLNPITKVRV
ncbi:hypothetical protein N7493_008118 [Penicillium malachiteum]|uniref:Uncharacterized protein n=1 Tax=Penicillium malachiteum TaxID=1324776 RepID=A0AAD6HH12_9EURO|nr:hypothetical protein N7493_008118 [Penicillium malachiteum]